MYDLIPKLTDTIVPFVIINLSTKSSFLSEHKILGFLDQTDTQICEIRTSSALEPLDVEVTSEQLENPLPYREGQFICSPVHILVHRKVDLQDAEVNEDIQGRFQDLCTRYSQFFSKDSQDFRHTDLVTVDTETGDSLPISQKPYNLSLKHTAWIQKEFKTLEKAGIIFQSVSWGQSHCGCPKTNSIWRTTMDRLCVDY